MRITGGTHRGRILLSPDNNMIRPTADRARLAIFNMLDSRGVLQNAPVMDVFCGTGALGLESLSRGATHATFVDMAKPSLDLAQKNAQALKLSSQCQFILADAVQLPACIGTSATLVFLDPPYGQDLLSPTIARLIAGRWLAPHAMLVAECGQDETPIWPDKIILQAHKTYGAAAIYLLEYTP